MLSYRKPSRVEGTSRRHIVIQGPHAVTKLHVQSRSKDLQGFRRILWNFFISECELGVIASHQFVNERNVWNDILGTLGAGQAVLLEMSRSNATDIGD